MEWVFVPATVERTRREDGNWKSVVHCWYKVNIELKSKKLEA